jgi:heat shock protein HslJ
LRNRRMIFVLALMELTALLTACSGFYPTMEPPSRSVALDGSEWVLTWLNGDRLVEGSNVTLSFAGGRAGGFAGCNSYGAGYEATGGGTLTIAEIEVTLQLCQTPAGVMEQEAAYLETLTQGGRHLSGHTRLSGDRGRFGRDHPCLCPSSPPANGPR